MKPLVQAMPSSAPPEWPGGRWIGSLDTDLLETDLLASGLGGSELAGSELGGSELAETETASGTSRIPLIGALGYARARLLIRDSTGVRGFVDVPIDSGSIGRAELDREVRRLPPAAAYSSRSVLPAMTVIVCTRDRAAQLRVALRAILDLDYPDFTVIVVDNASRTSETRDLVRKEFADPRLILIDEPIAGLSRARNAGLLRATGEIVAYTDDDVVVDSAWLRELAAGFDRAPSVACVSGLVPSGELRTRVQKYFDDRVSWSKNLTPRVYSLSSPPSGLPMFPFSIGEFGTGANFALRRLAALELGGFDEAFGVGTPTGGGEDIDMFTRVILDGRTLVMHPSAIVWHRHRDDLTALRVQARGYGTGLGAWLTKVLLNRKTAGLALSRSAFALRRLISLAWRNADRGSAAVGHHPDAFEKEIGRVGWLELFSVARGPFVYALQRSRGAGTLTPPVAPLPRQKTPA